MDDALERHVGDEKDEVGDSAADEAEISLRMNKIPRVKIRNSL